MKRIISIILCLFIILTVFSSCSKKKVSSSEKLDIVTTIFPEYDWVKTILGEKSNEANITLLLDNGIDLHSYQPTADDMVKISSCDMFVYVGGESDEWVDDALKNVVNKDMVVINLFDVLKEQIKEEELKQGMQSSEEAEEDEEGPEYDEHIWLSVKNAKTISQYISEKLCEIDSANKDIYTANTNTFVSELDKLDAQYEQAVANAKFRTLVFADRFPFRYLTDDYSIDYYAAFIGCSAETEASFETISFLTKKVDELSLTSVITLEGGDNKIANTVISNTQTKGQKIISLNSMQSTTSSDVENGNTYISIMTKNLELLKEALN